MPTEHLLRIFANDGDVDAMRDLIDGLVKGAEFETFDEMLASRRNAKKVGEVWWGGLYAYEVADSSTPVVNGYPLVTAGGVKLKVLPEAGGYNIKAFGAVGDGVADDTSALQAAADTGQLVKMTRGVYRVTGSIMFPGNMRMDFHDGAYIFADTGTYSKNYVLHAAGSVTQIGDLGTVAAKGSPSLMFATAPDLEFDDTLLIFNPTDSSWSGFRTNYKAGEFCHVESVSETTVALQAPLYDGYAAADVDVYKVTPISVVLRNPRLESNGSPLGLVYAEYARNPQIINPQMKHKNNSCIALRRCMDGDIFGGHCVNEGDGGDDYALAMGNCQHITVHGGSWYARRHATASGGDAEVGCIPCRGLKYIGARISNDRASGTHAADMHGNAEHCGYYKCHIMGGVSPQGADVSIVDCDVYGGMVTGPVVYASEVLGGHYRISGNRFHCFVNPQPSGRGVIDLGGNTGAINANTTRDLSVEFTGNTIVSDALGALTGLLYIRNSGTSKKINVDCRGNNFDVNDFSYAVWVRLASGTADSDFLIFDDNTTKLPGRFMFYPDANYVNGLSVARCQAHRWKVDVSVTAGTNSVAATSEAFHWRFPRAPVVLAGAQDALFLGGTIGHVRASAVSVQSASLAIGTDRTDHTDGSLLGFTTNGTVTLVGEAAIREV